MTFASTGKGDPRSYTDLWEVGYQAFNLIGQASGLDISYRAFILDTQQKKALETAEIKNSD